MVQAFLVNGVRSTHPPSFNNPNNRDFKFPRRRVWRYQPYGMLCSVVSQMTTDVLGVLTGVESPWWWRQLLFKVGQLLRNYMAQNSRKLSSS